MGSTVNLIRPERTDTSKCVLERDRERVREIDGKR